MPSRQFVALTSIPTSAAVSPVAGNVTVGENQTASVHYDVLADQSLHLTAKGDYVFVPAKSFATTKSRVSSVIVINTDISPSGEV